MIGLEYILHLYDMQHQELADKLNIKKQNINLWIKGKQNVSKKYLPTLSEMFGVDENFFQKELNEIDKLIIQKEKLKRELKPEIISYDTYLKIGENADLFGMPIYNKDIINDIEFEIKKTKVVEDIRDVISNIHDDVKLQMFEQIALLLRNYGKESIFKYSIDAVSHYYNVLPEWVSSGYDSNDFEKEFLKLAQKYGIKKDVTS